MSRPDRRAEIILAARETIAEQGFHGAPMAMIAARAGVGAGTIYRYFANKDLLITELCRELEGRIYPAMMAGCDPDGTVRERFIHLGSALMRYFIGHPLDFRYLQQFHNSPYGAAYRRDKLLGRHEGNDVYRSLFIEGTAAGVMKDLPLAILFSLTFGPLIAAVRDHVLGIVELDERLIAHIAEACWDAVRQV